MIAILDQRYDAKSVSPLDASVKPPPTLPLFVGIRLHKVADQSRAFCAESDLVSMHDRFLSWHFHIQAQSEREREMQNEKIIIPTFF